jgi:conjugal transfer mating pair stabilization protein TraG
MDPALAPGVIDGQIEQAYTKTKIAVAAQGAADLLRQNIMINLVQDTNSLAGLKLNDPAATMLATARANATASTNASFLTMGRIAAEALPMVRNVIEAVVYAVFPFVFLLFLLAQGRGLAMAIKSFVMSLVWIQLWPPLYAILNYVGTLASARNLAAAARMGSGTQGLTLDTAASIYQGAISDQAIAGYMVVSIPIIATAIIKGGEVAFQAVTATSAIQSAASSEAAGATKGLVTQRRGLLRPAAARADPHLGLHVQHHRRPRHHHPGQRAQTPACSATRPPSAAWPAPSPSPSARPPRWARAPARPSPSPPRNAKPCSAARPPR